MWALFETLRHDYNAYMQISDPGMFPEADQILDLLQSRPLWWERFNSHVLNYAACPELMQMMNSHLPVAPLGSKPNPVVPMNMPDVAELFELAGLAAIHEPEGLFEAVASM